MSQPAGGEPTRLKLGELLVSAGIVTSSDIVEALHVQKRVRIPIGRVLTASECVKKEILDAALEAQKTVRQGLDQDIAAEALSIVANDQVSFAIAREQAEESEATRQQSSVEVLVNPFLDP